MPQFSIDILLELGKQSHVCCWSASAGDLAQNVGPKALKDGRDYMPGLQNAMDIYGQRVLVYGGRQSCNVRVGVIVVLNSMWTPVSVTGVWEMKVGVALIRSPTCLTYPSFLGESDKVLI